jgi:lipopolysaccharide transport system ATP-binding protein
MSGTLGHSAERSYEHEEVVPQSDVVTLRLVRIVDRSGESRRAFDIREDIGIEVTYEVTRSGHVLIPNFQVYNQERIHAFTIQDVLSEWGREPKEAGRYLSTAWIPGNFMAEGSFWVNVAVVTYLPRMNVHFNAVDSVSFDVFDPMTGDTARGDFAGRMEGVVRPVVQWRTERN